MKRLLRVSGNEHIFACLACKVPEIQLAGLLAECQCIFSTRDNFLLARLYVQADLQVILMHSITNSKQEVRTSS